MPQIQEYLPQQQTQDPVGGTSPNIELVGSVGRSIENFGEAVEQGADRVHRRNVQAETANIYSDFADNRAEQTAKLQSQVQDGTLDVDKFQDEYDQSTQDTYDKISTPEGRNYFERQNARLRGQLLKSATAGMAQISARNAGAKWKNYVGATSSSLMNDPSSFGDAVDQANEAADSMVETGGLPDKMRAQAVNEMGAEFAKAAVRGWANLDPDHAKELLDKGNFDNYLNGEQKHQMYSEVQQYGRARQVENQRAEKATKDAERANGDAWNQKAMPQWVNNTLSAKSVVTAVTDGTLKPEQGERWIKMIDQRSKEAAGKSDPHLFMDLAGKISSGQIQDMQDLMPHVGHGLNTEGFNRLNTFIDKAHPEIKQGEKKLFQTIQAVRYKNPMTGQWDSDGDQKSSQAMHDYIDAKKTIKDKGGTVGDLTDPNSKFFFGSPENMAKYQTSLQDQLSSVSRDRTDKALGLKREGTDPAASAPAPVNKNVRQPNESAAQYLKRRGLGG